MEKINYESAVKNIRSEFKSYLVNSNLKSVVLGVSGGIDSALVAVLASPVCKELNVALIGRSLPIETNKRDEMDRAAQIGKYFCTNFIEINLLDKYIDFKEMDFYDPCLHPSDNKAHKIRMGNIKARLRMTYLYNLASKNDGLVLSTDNCTEWLLGFWTLHGDVGDYGMIQELWKTEVYDMAEWIVNNDLKYLKEQEALQSCIDALATDGLGVTDMGDLGQIMSDWKGNSRDGYKEVDKKLQMFLLLKEEAAMTPNVIKTIDKMIEHPVIKRHLGSSFKRKNPMNISRNLIIK